ncbi:hypothetical protein [Piscinibacter sp. XHJ-5]|uniref:hypothetical protein n=1 Tax=Piscinibacter sp. XHJ-5 TaxID=3037797 RepID=UPI002452F23E|nr:hypothetical protein [Piscinibacter sp. XHJ-5]
MADVLGRERDPAGVTRGEDAAASQLLTALTTEHFVLQTAATATITEASARATLYLLTLSSALVAMGFTAQSSEVFLPFVAAVLPALFLLGVFTVIRLVDTTLENMQYLMGIARIRSHYRSLGTDAARLFAAETGRWPEAHSAPALKMGVRIAFFGTTASMIAFINSVVAGAGVTLLAHHLLAGEHTGIALTIGSTCAVLLMLAFLAYQRWRFSEVDKP